MTRPKTPSHIVFHVKNPGELKAIQTEIGVAWPHPDGKGFSVKVTSIPIDGQLSLRDYCESRR